MKSLVALLALLFLLPSPNFAGIVKVPGDQPTIQAGIDAAGNGDTVLVAPGVYAGQLSIQNKSIVLLSEGGPLVTFIDCGGTGKGITFGTFSPFESGFHFSVIGFTIRQCSEAGIRSLEFTSPVVRNCILEYNGWGFLMGGCCLRYDERPIFEGCTFRKNTAGAVDSWGRPEFYHCRILENYGRPIRVPSGVFKNCLIARNIVGNINGATGAIGFSSSLFYFEPPEIINCTIADNVAELYIPGSIFFEHASAGISIDDNYKPGPLKITNSIIWGNTAVSECDGLIPLNFSGLQSDYDIQFSDVEGGWEGIGNISRHPMFLGPAQLDYRLHANSPCIDAGDPDSDFHLEPQPNGGRANLGAWSNTPGAEILLPDTFPYISHISPSSGCLTESTVLTIHGANFGDSQGDGYVEIGGQVYAAPLIWTDSRIELSVTGISAGDSLDLTVFHHIGTSFTCLGCVQAPVVQVTYVEGEVSGIWQNDCSSVYVLTGPVIVPAGKELLIEGGVKILADPSAYAEPISFHVYGILKTFGSQAEPIVFSVLEGQQFPGAWKGLFFEPSNAETDTCYDIYSHLTNSIVEFAEHGIRFEGGTSSWIKYTVIENCQIRQSSGHGIYFNCQQTLAFAKIIGCEIADNGGWGIFAEAFCENASGRVTALFDGNRISENEAGGIYLRATGGHPESWEFPLNLSDARVSPVIINNTIFGNGGLAIDCYARGGKTEGTISTFTASAYVNPSIRNNLLYHNLGGIRAQAPYFDFGTTASESKPLIINCTFWDNSTEEVTAVDSSFIEIQNSIFGGGPATSFLELDGTVTASFCHLEMDFPGFGNVVEDPWLADPSLGDFQLPEDSPAIDSGEEPPLNDNLDQQGHIRIVDGNGDGNLKIDRGALEYGATKPLKIIKDLTPVSVCENGSASFSVEASNGNQLTYQWFESDSPIPGAIASSITLDSITMDDQGKLYKCLVFSPASNESVFSQEVGIHVAGCSQLSGQVLKEGTSVPIAGADVEIFDTETRFKTKTDSAGWFRFHNLYNRDQTVYSGKWGFLHSEPAGIAFPSVDSITVFLQKGYQDDFIFDHGWTSSGNALLGYWTRIKPDGEPDSPVQDLDSDIGELCFVTGKGPNHDVDNGYEILSSPLMDMSSYAYPALKYHFWYLDNNPVTSGSFLTVYLSKGNEEALIETITEPTNGWHESSVQLQGLLDLADSVFVKFVTYDFGSSSNKVEAAIDGFIIEEGTPNSAHVTGNTIRPVLSVYPNPSHSCFYLYYDFPAGPLDGLLNIYDSYGRLVWSERIDKERGQAVVCGDLAPGVYFAWLGCRGCIPSVVKIVKMK